VFLLAFLRVRKFDQELAFENILRFYRVRREYPAIFNDLRPSSVAHALYGTRFNSSLLHRDRQGRLVTIIQPGEQLTLNTFTPSSLSGRTVHSAAALAKEKIVLPAAHVLAKLCRNLP
jgi:hypothetical protein